MHPDDQALSAYVEGNLFGPRRKLFERHLSKCGECTARLVAVTRTIQDTEFDAPPLAHHALEEFLAYVQIILPMPRWTLNILLYLITFGMMWVVSEARVYWFAGGIWGAVLPMFAELFAATYFFVGLNDLRKLVRSLAHVPVSRARVETFISQHIDPIFGWHVFSIGSKQVVLNSTQTTIFFGVSAFILSNVPLEPREYVGTLPLIYFLPVKAAWWAAGVFYLFLLAALIRLLRDVGALPPLPESENLRREIRFFIQRTTIVAAVSPAVWMIGTSIKGNPTEFWGNVFTIFLLLTVIGHLYFEAQFFRLSRIKLEPQRKLVEAITTMAVASIAFLPALADLIS